VFEMFGGTIGGKRPENQEEAGKREKKKSKKPGRGGHKISKETKTKFFLYGGDAKRKKYGVKEGD